MNTQPRNSFTIPHVCSHSVRTSCRVSVSPDGSADGQASTQAKPLGAPSLASSQGPDLHAHTNPCGVLSGVEWPIKLDSTCPEAVSCAVDDMSQVCGSHRAEPVAEAQRDTAVKAKPTWVAIFWKGILKFLYLQHAPATGGKDSTPHLCVISSQELQTRRNQRMRDLCEGTAYEFFVEVRDSATYYIRVYGSTTLMKVTFEVRAATATGAAALLM
jgi:hypothetical protein